MSIEEILAMTNRIENVDGEDVYVIGKEMHKEMKKLKKHIASKRESDVFAMLDKDVDFIRNHTGFAIAFRPVKWGDDRQWIPCLLYNYEGEWRRVVLQYAKCLKCDWIGSAASPCDPDLYITMKNHFEILDAMWQLPFLKCPKCGSKLSTNAIWIEDCK